MNRKRIWLAVALLVIVVVPVLVLLSIQSSEVQAQAAGASQGKINFFRLQDEGGWGSGANFIDADVVLRLEGTSRTFGLYLRNDDKLPVHQEMYDLLLKAYEMGWTVRLEYLLVWGDNGRIFRVILPN